MRAGRSLLSYGGGLFSCRKGDPMSWTPLSARERETVIILTDADDVARIGTHQRGLLTKLERNPSARKVEDLSYGLQRGAAFEMQVSLITFREVKRKGNSSSFKSEKRGSDIEIQRPRAQSDQTQGEMAQ